MAKIFVTSNKKKKKTESESLLDKEVVIKETVSIGQKIGLALLSLAIAIAVYFFTKKVLVPDIAIWARELISLILSLLVLAGFSAVSKGESKISASVIIFLFAIFIWQIVNGYSDHNFSRDEPKTYGNQLEVLSLTPREEPYIFHLAEIGDETRPFRANHDGKFNFNIKSHDYGFEIININELKTYQAYHGKTLPETRHPILVVKATKPNQNIIVTLSTR